MWMSYYATAIHPGQHLYQTIDWGYELPVGQYVLSLGHFSPDEPGFIHWSRSWESFALMFILV